MAAIDEPNIIQFLSLDSSLATWTMVKRFWKGLSEKHIDKGALKVISSQQKEVQKSASSKQQNRLRFISKTVWKLDKFTKFMENEKHANVENNNWWNPSRAWPVIKVKNIGTFITAARDFKSLQVTTQDKNIPVEMITSSTDNIAKCFIAVRSQSCDVNHGTYELGEKLKQIVNDMLCNDYNNFIGYVLYKKIDLNISCCNNHHDYDDADNQTGFDWIAEIFMHNKGDNSSIYTTLMESTTELRDIDVHYGVYQDNDSCTAKKSTSTGPVKL
eukprot:gene20472-22488_t